MRRILVTVALLASSAALSKAGGIAATDCSSCHGATAAAVSVSANPTTVSPGGSVTLTVSITSNAKGGFFMNESGLGTFALISGQSTRLAGDGVAHSTPVSASGGKVTFQVKWTAPSSPGGTDVFVWGVAANGNGTNAGDATGSAVANILYGCTGVTLYRDFDADGHGAASSGTTKKCAAEPGWSLLNDDCDDNDERKYPGKVEACNGRDDNCDGQVDEGLGATMTWADVDGDGYGDPASPAVIGCSASARAPNKTDCNDNDKNIHPGAAEVCNAKDDNCNGTTDEGVKVRCGEGWCARLGPTCDPSLCFPGLPSPEKCNLLDDDCDGQTDEGVTCDAGFGCYLGECLPELPGSYVDAGNPPLVLPDGGIVSNGGGAGGSGGSGGSVSSGGSNASGGGTGGSTSAPSCAVTGHELLSTLGLIGFALSSRRRRAPAQTASRA